MSSTTATGRPVQLPPSGTWSIDPGHAEVAFIGRHLGLTKVRGRFTGVEGTVRITDPLEQSAIEVVIDMASVDSGSLERDTHLRSGDLFDVDAHPTATFRSARIDTELPTARVHGDLTIKDITRPVTLEVRYLGLAVDPWDNQRAVFSASAVINRDDWGVRWNMALDAGGLLVSREIRLEVEVELLRRAD